MFGVPRRTFPRPDNAARLRRQARGLVDAELLLLAEAEKHYVLGDDDLLKDLKRSRRQIFSKTDDVPVFGDGFELSTT
jgi:hypothetical protein